MEKILVGPEEEMVTILPPEPEEPRAEALIKGREMPEDAEMKTLPPLEDEPVATSGQELQLLKNEPGVETKMLPPEAPDVLKDQKELNEPLARLVKIDPPVEEVEVDERLSKMQLVQVSLPLLMVMEMLPGLPEVEEEDRKSGPPPVGTTRPECPPPSVTA